MCMERDGGCDTALAALKDSQVALLPEAVLRKIANRMQSMSDVAHVRQTCKFLYKIFIPTKVRLGPLRHSQRDSQYWDHIFDHVIKVIKKTSAIKVFLTLDLSGNNVEQFMYSKHNECLSIRKLRLVLCRITSEGDNFFNPQMWANVEQLDLSNNFLGKRDREIGLVDWDSGTDIWPSICSLPKLKNLILRNNQLSSLSRDLYSCPSLEYLDVRGNPLPDSEIISLIQRKPKLTLLR